MMVEGLDAEQRKRLPNYLLDAAGISIERMPMLNVIFDRMAALCTDSLQPMASTPYYFSVNGISNGRVGDIIKDYEANAVAAVLYAEQWDTRVLILLDSDFVFTMVEALFGSDGAEPPIDVERSFSNIELRLVQVLFERFAKALQSAFAATSEVTFRLERVETAMASLAIGRSSNMSICANIMLQALYRGGQMFLIIPHSALLTTGGSLLFVGTTDGFVEALDAKTGDLLWRFNNGSGHNGGIISYAVGGKQYVAVATGHGSYVGRALADHYHKDKIINMKESAAIVVFSLE